MSSEGFTSCVRLDQADRLRVLLELQNELSSRVSLSAEEFHALPEPERIMWVERYLKALHNELEEVRNELAWKWWKKGQSSNWEKAKAESVDVLFFALNLCLVLGFKPDGNALFDSYLDKSRVNHKRQDTSY